MQNDRPNLLLLTTDEQRFDYLGLWSDTPVNTPNLDGLASEGAYHPNTYTINPLCMPARCSLLTGLYTHQHGVMNNRGDLNPGIATLPQALRNLGYTTALVGKEHFYEGFIDLTKARDISKRAFGWDYLWSVAGKTMASGVPGHPEASEDDWTHYLAGEGLLDTYRESTSKRMGMRANGKCEAGPSVLAEEHHVDYRIKEESLSYLRRQDSGKPFFLWASFCSPHFPFDPPAMFLERYDWREMPVPTECPEEQIEDYQRYTAAYCGMIEQIDSYVGAIVEELRNRGILETTMIVFLSDHGDMMGDFGLFAKNFPHEGSSRVPFIARYPEMIRPGSYSAATEITDIAATFLEIAGAASLQEHLPESPSQSLWPLWKGEALQRQYAFSENGYQFEEPFELLADAEWKYAFYSFSGKELLFNLKTDPHETENLASQEPSRLSEFRRHLLKRKASTPPPTPPEWIYQELHDADQPNPNRCHHGGLPEKKNRGIEQIL